MKTYCLCIKYSGSRAIGVWYTAAATYLAQNLRGPFFGTSSGIAAYAHSADMSEFARYFNNRYNCQNALEGLWGNILDAVAPWLCPMIPASLNAVMFTHSLERGCILVWR